MKKIFAATLGAALSAAAQAETSVTLYGLIDTGISYTRINGSYTDPKTGVTTGSGVSRMGATTGTTAGSRWGLRGKEDLGGGLYAMFQLESGFDSRNGSSLQENRLFGREATIGLGSAEWGEFRFGRQYNVGTRYFGHAGLIVRRRLQPAEHRRRPGFQLVLLSALRQPAGL